MHNAALVHRVDSNMCSTSHNRRVNEQAMRCMYLCVLKFQILIANSNLVCVTICTMYDPSKLITKGRLRCLARTPFSQSMILAYFMLRTHAHIKLFHAFLHTSLDSKINYSLVVIFRDPNNPLAFRRILPFIACSIDYIFAFMLLFKSKQWPNEAKNKRKFKKNL